MTNWKDLLPALQQHDAKWLQCGNCKITLEDILKIGRLGCSQCYNIFGSTLRRIVEQMNNVHIGKRPKSGLIKGLENQMATAALEGRYEDAEWLRDEIKRLRGT